MAQVSAFAVVLDVAGEHDFRNLAKIPQFVTLTRGQRGKIRRLLLEFLRLLEFSVENGSSSKLLVTLPQLLL